MITQKQKNSQSEYTSAEKWLGGFAIGFAIFGLLTFIASILLFKNGETFNIADKINSTKYGDYGSFISGAVGTFWTLVSVILFYLTLRLQRKELALQRDELELTRVEISGQKDQMIKQNETLSHQQFENTFFQLVNVHTNIVNSIDLRSKTDYSKVISEGRDCFKIFYNRLESSIKEVEDPHLASLETTLTCYDKFFSNNEHNLGHYFRNLYHIIKFVDRSNVIDKKTYTNFVRAQLSTNEHNIFFYNGLTDIGSEKFKPLIEKYALLKNMNTDLVFNKLHLKAYSGEAFE